MSDISEGFSFSTLPLIKKKIKEYDKEEEREAEKLGKKA
jgi:hypothetical protein